MHFSVQSQGAHLKCLYEVKKMELMLEVFFSCANSINRWWIYSRNKTKLIVFKCGLDNFFSAEVDVNSAQHFFNLFRFKAQRFKCLPGFECIIIMKWF